MTSPLERFRDCDHDWSERDHRGRRLEDAMRCTKCGIISHWFNIIRDLVAENKKLKERLPG